MLAIERRNLILEKLSKEGKVLVSDLSREFGVAEETVRRDLEKLSGERLLTKTYGGAVASHNLNADLPYNIRKSSNIELKRNIAKKIARMIPDGCFLMLDASSTAVYIAREITDRKNITLITNSVEILFYLNSKTSGWNVLSTGGTLKEGALSLVGSSAERMIEGFHVDIAVCSAKGIDIEKGVTDSNEKDAQIKKAIFGAADRRVLAVDSTKFDKISFVKVCGFSDIDTVVTDAKPGDIWTERMAQYGVELIY